MQIVTGRCNSRGAWVCGLLLAVLWLPVVAGGAEPGFGRTQDVAFARQLWKALERLQLAGPKAYRTVPFAGQYPHGSMLELFTTSHLAVAGRSGAVLVLRSYRGDELTPKQVRRQPGRYLSSISVMFQRPGFDPADHNWFWAEFQPDGELGRNAAGRRQAGRIAGKRGCTGCHSAAPGDDLVFSSDRFR